MGRAIVMHKVATEAPCLPLGLLPILLLILFVDQKRNAIKAKSRMHALDISSVHAVYATPSTAHSLCFLLTVRT